MLNKTIATSGNPIHGVLRRDGLCGQADRFKRSGLGSGFGAPQEGFNFASDLFNRIEVRRADWQEKDLGSSLVFVRPKVFHYHHGS